MALIDDINKRSKEIHTDEYSISIGELVSMYKDGDLDIHPEFQRFFRWTNYQKTMLIESFLLNIPVPPIFLSQRKDGVWEIVDGLQRVSTILHFFGEYKDINGEIMPPLRLEKTKLLPSLDGKYFNKEDDLDNSFTDTERRYLKRAKISLKILLKDSDDDNKYELFQRLNTGGTSLSDQEVRNCLLVMTNNDNFKRFQILCKYVNFQNTLRLSDKSLSERYDMELASRFICLRNADLENLSSATDFGEYLNDTMVDIVKSKEFDWQEEMRIFEKTFDLIYSQMGDEAFCKYGEKKIYRAFLCRCF